MVHNLTAYRATVNMLILSILESGLASNCPPTSKDIPPPLDPKDYPNVQFWTAKAFDAYCNNLTGEMNGLATQQKQRGRRRKNENNEGRYPYLENADGTPVPWEVIVKIRQKARRVWHTLHNIDQAPPSWGKASETAYTYFNSEMLNVPELEFFRYCEGNWRVTRWATKAYASWAHNYLKSKEAADTNVAWVNKRKRELLDDDSLLQIDNDSNKGNVIAQPPEPSPIQNASISEAALTPPAPTPPTPTPPTPALAPTQVSTQQISRPLLITTKRTKH
jgi:hypothetical protein